MSKASRAVTSERSGLSVEIQALVQGLRGEAPDNPHLDWAELCRLALAHGVAPLLHQSWAPLPAEVPAPVLSDLAELRRQSRKQGLLGLHQRDELLRLLADDGVHPIVLKGGAWARPWYGDVSLRPFNDIDLLVSVQDMERARGALLAAGYVETGEEVVPHHGAPLQHPVKPLAVELHRWVLALPASDQWEYEDVRGRSLALDGKDVLVYTLDPEDTLVHLCVHLLQHMGSEPGWKLLNVWDIARHVQSRAMRWEVFEQRASQSGVVEACHAALGLVALLTEAPIPGAQGDIGAGSRLLDFPFMHCSFDPVYHRSALSLIDILSHPGRWQTWPGSVRRVMRRRSPRRGVVTGHAPKTQQPARPLLSFPREVGWLLRAGFRLRTGQIQQGIRQLRWEEQARHTVNDLLRQPQDGNHSVSDRGGENSEERAWPARP